MIAVTNWVRHPDSVEIRRPHEFDWLPKHIDSLGILLLFGIACTYEMSGKTGSPYFLINGLSPAVVECPA
jgi:hypothetical protein